MDDDQDQQADKSPIAASGGRQKVFSFSQARQPVKTQENRQMFLQVDKIDNPSMTGSEEDDEACEFDIYSGSGKAYSK